MVFTRTNKWLSFRVLGSTWAIKNKMEEAKDLEELKKWL